MEKIIGIGDIDSKSDDIQKISGIVDASYWLTVNQPKAADNF